MQHNSSIVIEVIRTILEFLLIYFFYKKILDIPKAQKSTKKHKETLEAQKRTKGTKSTKSTKTQPSSNVIEVIRPILNFIFFFLQKYFTRTKSFKKHKKV